MTHYLDGMKMGDDATNVALAGQVFDALMNEFSVWIDLPDGRSCYFGTGEEGQSFEFVKEFEAVCESHTHEEYRVGIKKVGYYVPSTRSFDQSVNKEMIRLLIYLKSKLENIYIYSSDVPSLNGKLHTTQFPLFTNGAVQVKRIEHWGNIIWTRP